MPYRLGRGMSSSPDPLNDSLTFSSPAKAQTPKKQRSVPLQGGSPKKQTFQLDVGDQISPQKIRVTVEAEPSEGSPERGRRGSGVRSLASPVPSRVPTLRQGVRTTTTTVPVKGLSDTDDGSTGSACEKPKRGRGRPRKSFGTPVPTRSRNQTVTPAAKPSPRRRRTLGHLVDGDDPEDWDFAIGAGVEVGRGKGRSRSRSVKGAARNKSTPAAKHTSSPDKTVSSTTSRTGRERKKTLALEEVMIHEDEVDSTNDLGVDVHEGGMGTEGVLTQRNTNLAPTHSAYATNQVDKDTENDNPGISYDNFCPAKKIPARAKRPGPRLGSSKPRSSNSSFADGHTRRTNAPVESPLELLIRGETTSLDTHDNVPDDENNLEEPAEFDTILESEGFSMISVESMPSLRERLSSPSGPDETKPESGMRAPNLQASGSQNSIGAQHEDSFSSIAPEILQAATPRKKASNTLLRAVLSSHLPEGDSFSSITPEILDAATPANQKPRNRFLSIHVQHRTSNDDSFSSIPPAILEAATPAKYVRKAAGPSNTQLESREEPQRTVTLAIGSSLRVLHTERQSLTSSGLLTPNETPSPTEMNTQQPKTLLHEGEKTRAGLESGGPPLAEGSSILSSQMRSSPPSAASRPFSSIVHSHQSNLLHASHMETPSMVFSSPSLPPLITQRPVDRAKKSSHLDSNQLPRQSLSPIVRAGRVLQDLAMTSTSMNRTQSLGSPFKSPAAQRIVVGTSADAIGDSRNVEKSQNIPKNNKGKDSDLFKGFSDDSRRELRKSMIIGEELASNQECKVSVNLVNLPQDHDPFRGQSRRSPSHRQGQQYALELPSHNPRLHTGLKRQEQECRDSMRSDSAMSWQAESTVPVPTSSTDAGKTNDSHIFETTELFQNRREAEWASERAAISSQIESASPSKVIIIESESEEDSMNTSGEVNDEGEEDIWQIEARHSSSILEEQASQAVLRQEPLEKPRRSKIPSPWRKNSKRLIYSDELAEIALPQQPQKLGKLSSDIQVKPIGKHTGIKVQKRAASHSIVEDEEDLSELSITWHIPQKSNFAPRPRDSGNLDLSALLGSSPLKRPHPPANLNRSSGASVCDTNCDNLQDGSSIVSSSASYESSELVSEASHDDSQVLYPSLPSSTSSLSPQKSCLRTPTASSPVKTVAFLSPTPSPPPLSGTTWSKAHWQFLHGIYNGVKLLHPRTHPQPSTPLSEMDSSSQSQDSSSSSSSSRGSGAEQQQQERQPSQYLGKSIHAQGEKLKLEQWHLDIVAEFREDVPGWDEGVIAKRLFAIIVGEGRRMAAAAAEAAAQGVV